MEKMYHYYINTQKNSSKINIRILTTVIDVLLAMAIWLLVCYSPWGSDKWNSFWYLISCKIFVVVIITSSIRLVGIICHYIVLCYLVVLSWTTRVVHNRDRHMFILLWFILDTPIAKLAEFLTLASTDACK